MIIRPAHRSTGHGLARGTARRTTAGSTRRHKKRFVAALAAALAGVLALAACSSEDASYGTVRVSAAASLSVTGEDLRQLYAAEQDGQQIEWNFAASSAPARPLEQGSPADAFISADAQTMHKALKTPDI